MLITHAHKDLLTLNDVGPRQNFVTRCHINCRETLFFISYLNYVCKYCSIDEDQINVNSQTSTDRHSQQYTVVSNSPHPHSNNCKVPYNVIPIVFNWDAIRAIRACVPAAYSNPRKQLTKTLPLVFCYIVFSWLDIPVKHYVFIYYNVIYCTLDRNLIRNNSPTHPWITK